MLLCRARANPRLLAVVALSLAAACATDLSSFAERYTTASEREFPRVYLQWLADAQLDSASSLLAPELRSDTTRSAMGKIGLLLKEARLDSMRLIGVNLSTLGDGREVNLSYEIPTGVAGHWVMSNVATRRAGTGISVIGFSAYPINGPLEVVNRFTLSGKSAAHYAWLTLAVLIPIGTIAVAVSVARTRGMPRRWLWVIASLVATPTFSINWTTGRVGMQGLSFLFFGGAASSAGAAAPWIVSFAMPIGALIAYIRVRRWRQGVPPTTGAGPDAVAA